MAYRLYVANDDDRDVTLKEVCNLDLKTAAVIGGGAWLIYHGLKAGGLISAGLTVGGVALLATHLTGKSLGELLHFEQNDESASADAPSYADHGMKAQQEPEDAIDEAAMESFPASDPPASYHSTQLPPEN